MKSVLEKIAHLEKEHAKLDPELVARKKVKLGLRNEDGTGVVAGITSKGQVIAYKKDRYGKKISIPGKLYYCGYDVEDIVRNIEKEKRYGFEEVIYLLLTSELPKKKDLESFTEELANRRPLSRRAKDIIRFNSENDDQMGALHAAISSLHKFDPNARSTDIRDVTWQCVDIIAKFPVVIAYNYKVMTARLKKIPSFVEPDAKLSTAQNFMYMLTEQVPDDLVAQTLDLSLILHAEHGGGNNSTFTVRTVSSALTDTYMAICAGVASLAGHLHGGANEAVTNMMEGVKQAVKDWKDDDQIRRYLRGLLEKKCGDRSGKIYGMGHAVYKMSDPRVAIMRDKAALFAERKGRTDELELYDRVAEIAVGVIKEKKGNEVCPNVDFYSGFVYDMMGIPIELFTPVFAMSRVAGWSAHRIEEIIQGKLIRPAYATSIEGKVRYVPISKR